MQMFQSKKKRIRRSQKKQTGLHFESLESKQLLAGIVFDSATGVVTVNGSANADYVQVFQDASDISVVYHDVESQSFDKSDVKEVVFNAFGGDDWLRNNTSISVRGYGHAGNDTLIGGDGIDRLFGGTGDDLLLGMAGDDFLFGSDGADRIHGFDGNDQMLGGTDSDLMTGGLGDDTIFGQGGDDSVFGNDDNDWLSGGMGDDILSGQSGMDRAKGDQGNDRIWGGAGDDHLSGNAGDDRVVGNQGDDTIHGDDGVDTLFGAAGLDRIFGGGGDDGLFGGEDDDWMFGSTGQDLMMGGGGNDFLFGQQDTDYINGQAGNDQMYAGDGDDVMRGGQGLDDMYGQNGSDDMDGQDDNDDLHGGPGSDRMRGGHGNDDYSSDSSDDIDDDEDDFSPDGDFEIRGTVANSDANAKTFTLLGLTVDYSSAEVEGNITNGSFVKSEGAFDGSVVTAYEVERENDDRNDNFEARGVVSNLDTSAQSFEMFGLTIDYSTAEVKGTLADGENVKVEGNLANNVVNAREVETANQNDDDNDNDSNRNLELRGALANLDTNAKTFTLLGVVVDYSQSQVRTGLSEGAFVKVDGAYNGTELLAREVEAETDDDRDENVEALGVVSNLDLAAKTFELLGFAVDFGDAKLEGPFANGDTVEVEGWFSNFSIDAEEIKV
jgi:Ca2+-binding RTX toxin-like protein